MSASPATSVTPGLSTHPRRGAPRDAPASLLVFATSAIVVDVLLVAGGLWVSRGALFTSGWTLLAWATAVGLVGLVSVSSPGGSQLGLDMPLLLAAGFLFGPPVAGALAVIAYVDVREWRREIPPLRALFNRAQTSLSVMAATAVFGLAGGEIGHWPSVGFAGLLAVAIDCLCNYGLVVAARALSERVSPLDALTTLHIGSRTSFVASYASYGLLSPVLAEVFASVGAWGLVSFVLPVVLARQAFEHGRLLANADWKVKEQTRALEVISTRVAEERRDERLSVAAGLHDEVLPPLYQVHLMGQVLRQDLSAGRLLDLEDDLPDLLRAVDRTSDAIRDLIRGLRESSLGGRGLGRTLELLVRHLETLSSARFELQVASASGPPLVELLAYQVAREALMNAVRHAQAQEIRVHAFASGEFLRVVVEDDGVGFDPAHVDGTAHFGLALSRERVELVGGVLQVDARPGSGTRVVARLPLQPRIG